MPQKKINHQRQLFTPQAQQQQQQPQQHQSHRHPGRDGDGADKPQPATYTKHQIPQTGVGGDSSRATKSCDIFSKGANATRLQLLAAFSPFRMRIAPPQFYANPWPTNPRRVVEPGGGGSHCPKFWSFWSRGILQDKPEKARNPGTSMRESGNFPPPPSDRDHHPATSCHCQMHRYIAHIAAMQSGAFGVDRDVRASNHTAVSSKHSRAAAATNYAPPIHFIFHPPNPSRAISKNS